MSRDLAEEALPPFEKEVYDLLRETYYDIWYQVVAIRKEEWDDNGLRWPLDFMVRSSSKGRFFTFLLECLPGDTTSENLDGESATRMRSLFTDFQAKLSAQFDVKGVKEELKVDIGSILM